MEMESNTTTLGTSLQVPIVQELAKRKISTVPPRYVRTDLDHLPPSNLSSSDQIPVVDMLKLCDPDSSDSELSKLHHACTQWGFFQLMNHGVEWRVVETMKQEIEEFFNLPIEEKNKYKQRDGEVEGYGQAFVVSEEQKLDWADLFFIKTLPNHLRKPHLIPNLPRPFRDAIDSYAKELKDLGIKILKQMARALRMQIEDIETLFEEGMQAMRMNYYPPCPQPHLVNGLCPHSDAVGLTILLQVNQIKGLQINKDGKWIPIVPLPNAFIVNIGDIMEIVTNGIYRSIEHRATVNSTWQRLSIATFLSPKLDGDFGPAPSLVNPETPSKFKRIGTLDYFRGLFSRKLDKKSYLDAMRL